MATRAQILAKIKELIEALPLVNPKIYDKAKDLDDVHLQKLLVILYDLNQKREAAGGEKADDDVITYYQKEQEIMEKLIQKEAKNMIKQAEAKNREKEKIKAEALLNNL